ncbi:MAG TPA: hypothetical protein IAC37_08200 [Candidatus Ventrimonas merdavium]|nr:hypothetical protein [Candidatus Ventrimonas merdavium]
MIIRKLVNYWVGRRHDGLHMFCGTVCALLYLAGWLVEEPGGAVLKRAGTAGMFVLLLGILLHVSLHGFSQFLDRMKDEGQIPRKQMEQVASLCLTIFLLAAAVGMAGAAWGGGRAWQTAAAWLAEHLEPVPAPSMEPAFADLDAGLETAGPNPFVDLTEPPPEWVQAADRILEIVGEMILILMAAAAAYQLARGVWKFLIRPRNWDTDEKIYLRPALFSGREEQARGEGAPGKDEDAPGRFRLRPTYTQRIRRQYRKEIRAGFARNRKVPEIWASPEELEDAAGCRRPALHGAYEKARYSGKPCDEKDWEQARRR